MITVKRLLLIVAALSGALLLAALGAYLLVSDEKLVAWLAQRSAAASGISISYQQPVELSRTLAPTLSVTDLVVELPGQGYRLHTQSLEVQLSLPRLLLGQLDIPRLWLGNTRIEAGVAAQPRARQPASGSPFSLPLQPAFHDVKIAQLSLVHSDGELLLPTLDVDELAVALSPDSDTLALRARLQLAGEAIDLDASAPGLQRGLNGQRLDFTLAGRSAVGSLDAAGYLDFAKPEFVLDGGLSAQATDVKQIPTGIEGVTVPGSLSAQARFHGTFERLAVTDLVLQWRGPVRSALHIRGSVDDLDDLAGIGLEVAGQLAEASWLAPLLPDSVGALEQAELKARVSGDARELNIREFGLSARDANDLQLSLNGQFDVAVGGGSAAAENLDLALNFEAPTTRAARALLFEDIPEFGAVQGRADIRSETGDPAFENIAVSTRDPAGIEVDLGGRIASFPLDPGRANQGYDLDVRMKAAQASLFGERLHLKVPLAGPLTATYRIEGDTQALRLEQIELAAGEGKTIRMSAEGQVRFRDWDQADPLEMVNLAVQASSADSKGLAKVLGTELPELGALSARAKLQTVSNRHQIKDFQLQTAKGAPVAVALKGKVDDVVLLPKALVEGIALSASASTAEVSRLNALFGWQDTIPAIGPAAASATITGSDQQLSVADVSITAGNPDILMMKANGRIGTLLAANDWRPQGADLNIKANAPGSKAFAAALGYVVPELGPLAASAQLRDTDRTLALESGTVRIGDAWKPAVKAEGAVNDLLGQARTRWDVVLDLDGHQFAQFADYKQIPDLGTLQGKLQISNGDGSLGIDSMTLASSGSELLSLALDGSYGDFGSPESLSLNGTVKARDLEIVGALLDRDWPAISPFEMTTKLNRVVNSLQSGTRITAGKAVVRADLVATLEAQPLLISGRIVASNAFIPSLVKWRTERIAEHRAASGPVFGRERIPFDWLNKFDLDLSLDVESFDPELSPAQSAKADIAMSSGQLWVRPAAVKYPVGELELELHIDAREQPRVRVKAHGANLRPMLAV